MALRKSLTRVLTRHYGRGLNKLRHRAVHNERLTTWPDDKFVRVLTDLVQQSGDTELACAPFAAHSADAQWFSDDDNDAFVRNEDIVDSLVDVFRGMNKRWSPMRAAWIGTVARGVQRRAALRALSRPPPRLSSKRSRRAPK